MWWFSRKSRPQKTPPLISPRQATKGVLLTGEVGSGKTTILCKLLEEWACTDAPIHFALPTIKPTDSDMYETILRRAGRNPLRIKADGEVRISPYLHEMTRLGGGARNLAVLHEDLIEVLTRSDNQRTETYWKALIADTMRLALELCFMVKGRMATYSDVEEVIMSIPLHTEEAASDAFAKHTACGQFLDRAYTINAPQANVMANHFLKRLPGLGDRGRGAVLAGAMQTLQPFTLPPISMVVNGEPTHTVEQLLEMDTIWDVDVHTYGRNGLALQLMLAWLCQEQCLRRRGDFDYFALIRDEYGHSCHAERDIRTISTGRSQKYIGAVCTQSLPTLESQLGAGQDATTNAKAVYGLHVNKIMCRQSDTATAELNAETLGRKREMFFSGGSQPKQTDYAWWDVLGVGDQPSFGFQENYHYRCPPLVFQTLAAGGREHNYTVEAIISDGSDHFFRHSFFQR